MIKKNDVIEITITDISNDGNGVGRFDGVVVFVPYSAIGDVLEVRVLKIAKTVMYGKIERIINASADRIKIDCDVFAPAVGGKTGSACGGCDFRHITYNAELFSKDRFIRDAFTRIGKLNPEFQPIIASDNTEHYRNKAQYPVDGEVTGFYAARSHRIVPHEECKLQPKIFGEIVDFIMLYNLSLRHICIRKGHYSGEINVTLVSYEKNDEFYKIAKLIMENFKEVRGVVLNINKGSNNVILGDEEIVLSGEGDIFDTMCGVKLRISPKSFYQVNTPTAEKLYEVIHEFTEPDGKTILDLYCGIGSIGLSMACKAKEVVGVDRVKSAIENARLNGFENTRFICGDVGDIFNQLSTVNCPLSIILDPARKGCESAVLENVAKLSPERIVMVSCDPATAARDCARLGEHGYKTKRVRGVDMFPRTRHVECVALLVKE
ncbi:MAG: 23S rRNA (uracil(1939)-C(5))-methyltransferase RlmD [Oscillospiraceae bacterium]|nr:23S rRNA (uracil(1939)-C(5))-methyltransferase RlmD [Oscillospiraceae bacterium]